MNQQTGIVDAMARNRAVLDMELDKIPGAWVVTAWLEEVVLRLRIEHWRSDEVCRMACEVRLQGAAEFATIQSFSSTVWELVYTVRLADLGDFPEVWRWEFTEMAWRWAACVWILEFGTSVASRYACEPGSSRDCFTGEWITASNVGSGRSS